MTTSTSPSDSPEEAAEAGVFAPTYDQSDWAKVTRNPALILVDAQVSIRITPPGAPEEAAL